MRIAIIDSGVFEGHPHVGKVAAAVQITASGMGNDPLDRLGHGTAVAAAIREKAPHADLYSVRVFGGRLAASMEVILRALAWCRDQEIDLINLSLGTSNPDHRTLFTAALAGNGVVVSAANLLPGTLPGVIGVDVDAECPRDRYGYRDGVFWASPYPRPIEGVPPSRNLQGVSFAVANMTGLIAQRWPIGPRDDLRSRLADAAQHAPRALSELTGVL
ncbi:MAG: S8 family serine peptidase [Acidobacteriota bacterium]